MDDMGLKRNCVSVVYMEVRKTYRDLNFPNFESFPHEIWVTKKPKLCSEFLLYIFFMF